MEEKGLFKDGTVRFYEKGTILLYEGIKAKHVYKVLKGCLKSYVLDEQGKEYIVQFAPEDWIITDMNSLLNDVPSSIFIETIEDSEVILMGNPAANSLENAPREILVEAIQKFQKNIISHNKRIIHLLSSTAEKRYLDFMETYPTLYQRLPLKLIALYLGITPEFLSRIRKNLVEKR